MQGSLETPRRLRQCFLDAVLCQMVLTSPSARIEQHERSFATAHYSYFCNSSSPAMLFFLQRAIDRLRSIEHYFWSAT
ncbi:hypothetical protein [Noviherbaspirillum autotrophicum]|uniref:hypothetical protein n=1 Tax=Noviherbaspirillum autotrophicum TaxID=709839 RepID=UPI000A82927E|nr:hypothetical protein [Noviherbaspirillum autotrophicum]